MRHSIKKLGLFLTLNILVLFSLSYGTAALAGDAILTWNPNTEPDLAGYKIYYGTASGSYGAPIDAGNQTTYTITGLGYGTYYFAVKAYDTTGNLSGSSNEVNKTLSDTTPPVISAISAGGITSTGATISWTTDEPATSLVEYGTTTAYGSSTPFDSTLVIGHNKTLGGLQASMIYHYRIRSADATGNLAISGDNTFVTAAAPDTTPPVISGITAGSVTSTSATISWTTDEPSDTQVQYGTTMSYGASTILNSSLVTSHSQSLTVLQPSTLYNFRVLSRDAAGNLATSGNNTFTTSAPPDTTPPVISGITASNITNTGAVITWTTNETANSQVEYGTTTAYGSLTTLDSALVTNHSATLNGLTASITYHYHVKSADAAGNLAVSNDNTFITSAPPDTTPPLLSGITVSSVTNTGAVVTWTTNEASTSQVEYGPTVTYGSSSNLSSTLVTGHSITLTGLTASTLYHYYVKSADAAGNLAVSDDNTFTASAPPDTTGPVLSLITASNITAADATITWGTDEPASSQVEYGLTAFYGNSTTVNATLLNSHSQILTGLQASTLYHYRVKSADSAGNLSVSGDLVLTTGSAADTTPPGNIQNFSAKETGHQISLSWLNPPDLDFIGVRIRYRTDHYPTDTNDGVLLGDFTGLPNQAMSTIQTPIVKHVTYYYAASTYDSSGNYQHTAYASVTTSLTSDGSGSPDNVTMSGGCGMVRPGSGKPPGPGQSADMIFLLVVLLIAILKREIQKKKSFDRVRIISGIILSSLFYHGAFKPEEISELYFEQFNRTVFDNKTLLYSGG
ncbi:MAG: hypothetical protein HY283_10560 [Nitrospirae bacterium]|nr:hypothetical protein [Nitrospirota bacterium]